MKGIIAGVLALVFAGVAQAQPSVNPQTTKQMPRKPSLECSVTAGGPSYVFHGSAITLTYGGGVSCAGGMDTGPKTKTVKVWLQTAGSGPNRGRYFDVAGSTRTATGTGNPIRVSASRQVRLGHAYRVAALGTVSMPNGFAGCSLHKPPACTEMTFASVIGPTLAP